MLRMALYVSGFSVAVATVMLLQNRKRAMRPVSVKQAAAMLQQAWADHHTVA
jgi:hypothetical protein